MARKKQHRETQRLKIQRWLENLTEGNVFCDDGVFDFCLKGHRLHLTFQDGRWVLYRRFLFGDPPDLFNFEDRKILKPFNSWRTAIRSLQAYVLILPYGAGPDFTHVTVYKQWSDYA